MDLLTRKTELYESMTGKTSKWLKAWAKVIVIIFAVFSILDFIIGIPTIADSFKNPFSAISKILVIVNLAVLILAVVNAKKLNNIAFFTFIGTGVITILTSIISFISTIGISFDDYLSTANLVKADLNTTELQAHELVFSMIVPTAVITAVIYVILYGLHIFYMLKRKDIFYKTVEELELEAGVSDNAQYTPYINPQG